MRSTTGGKIVTRSRSQKVKIVSRCMKERSRGIRPAITRSAWPPANSRAATAATACGVERSPMPMRTMPLPTGMTSPPSSVAITSLIVNIAPPHLEGGIAEARVKSIDRGDVRRLRAARGPVHGVDGDAAVDPARAVAGEELVGQRRR